MRTTLEQLLAPMSVDQFVTEYLDQRAVHLRAPDRGNLSSLKVPLRSLHRWATDPDPSTRRAQVYDGKGKSHDLMVSAGELESHFLRGMTVHVAQLQRTHPDLARVAGRIKAELNFAGHVNCAVFISPGGGGFPMHFDSAGLFSFQIEGSKRWKYSRAPAMKAPPTGVLHNQTDQSFAAKYPWARYTRPEDAEFDEVTLEPGDVLYLPAGTWHEPRAGEHSAAITFGLVDSPLPRLLLKKLEEDLFEEERWRAPLAPMPEAFLRERISELSARLAALRPDQLGVDLAPTELSRSASSLISPDDRLTVPHRLELLYGADNSDGDEVVLRNRFREVTLGIEALPLLERLVTVEHFTARDGVSWGSSVAPYAWCEIGEVLEGLLEAGLVRHSVAAAT